jgi:hypothetical protein
LKKSFPWVQYGFANLFVRWNNITIDASKSRGAYGGEDVTNVLKQRESNELLNPRKGFSFVVKMSPSSTMLVNFLGMKNILEMCISDEIYILLEKILSDI